MKATEPKARQWQRALAAAAAGGAVALPAPWQALGLVLAISAWLALRPGRKRLLVAGPLLLIALVASFWGIGARGAGDPLTDPGVPEALLSALDAEAAELAAVLGPIGPDRNDRQAAFRTLERRGRSSGREEWTWLVIDPDGAAVAWAGRGLVHEFAPEQLPNTGRIRRAGYTAVTWAAVRPLEPAPSRWRLMVGTSVETVGSDLERGGERRGFESWAPASVAAALVLLALFGAREPSRFRGVEGRFWRHRAALLLSGAAIAMGAAFGLGLEVRLALLISLVTLLVLGPLLRPRSRGAGVVQGIASTFMLLAAATWVQRDLGPLDLGTRFFGDWPEFSMRLALFAFALGTLPVSAGPSGDERVRTRWGAAAFAALLAGAALHTIPAAGILLLALAAGTASLALRGVPTLSFQRLLLAGLLAALSWEIAYHAAVDRALETAVGADLAPPSESELDREADRLADHFQNSAWSELAVPLENRDTHDLAFAIWLESPLSARRGLSSLVVERGLEPLSIFSFGLPMSDEGTLNDAATLRDPLTLPGWEQAWVQGASPISFADGTEGLLRYYFLPRPGFRDDSSELGGLAAGLLRGDSVLAGLGHRLPEGVLPGYYDRNGAVLLAPWKGAGNLDLEAGGRPPAEFESSGVSASVFAAPARDGWRVLFLPTPSRIGGFERIATHALSPLLALVVALGLAFFLRIGRKELWELGRGAWGSYSRRMILFTTCLLIVPVVLLSAFVLRMVAQRVLDQQLAAGEAALESAQTILGDYVLALDPGFGIATTLDDELLIWLSDAVHHEVNLYWGSQLYASSKRELFSAGILPERIPGEIYSRLALGGSGLASRTSRAQGSAYREFYAPLTVPGVPVDANQLFLSMPLLAQEEEAALDIATMRRRLLIVAIATALLLVAFGRRFLRTFTEPIVEIVRGTERIALGAPKLGYLPKDRELANLATAIDEMAAKIAEARTNLLREKEVVDRIVDNITAGVVSLDRDGNVLLLNRTAHELLGLSVGEPLVGALEARPDLETVAEFVRTSGGEARQGTVELGREPEEAGQWSLVWVPIPSPGEPSALFVIEDVTEVLRAQRLEAWAEMARIIAHEIKNPLTPIRLSTEHLREIYKSRPQDLDKIFERCTTNILTQVEELRQIAGDFSTYSRIPEIKREPGDLAHEVTKLVDVYRLAPPPGVDVSLEIRDGVTQAEFDARLVNRAVRNLIENAVRASQGGGQVRVIVSAGGPGDAAGAVEVRVEDSGPGVEPALLPRIFEPYFSTDEQGTGLGLAIARRIVSEHGGSINARNLDQGGLAVTIRLPAGSSS